jgi:hypothetical protein
VEQQQLNLPVVIPGRKRARKAPPPSEFKLHCQLGDILRDHARNPLWRYTHLPMGEYRTPETRGRLKRMGVTRGWPDFMFVGPGCVFFLELKRPRMGRLSDEQIAMRAHLIKSRMGYLATSSVKDAVSELQDYGILPRGIRFQ